jgi:hypothetical protein
MKQIIYGVSCFLVLTVLGCSQVKETVKVLWGSSTRALEKARDTASRKTFSCERDKCMDAVVELVRANQQKALEKAKKDAEESEQSPQSPLLMKEEPDTAKPEDKQGSPKDEQSASTQSQETISAPAPEIPKLKIFLQDRVKSLIVLMNVPGCVDTTEVGLFFVTVDTGKTRVEVSSLSEIAKMNTAEIIFPELAKNFPVIEDEAARPHGRASDN